MPARNLIKATNARFAKSLEEAMGCNDELVELIIRQMVVARNNCSWFNDRLLIFWAVWRGAVPAKGQPKEKPSRTPPLSLCLSLSISLSLSRSLSLSIYLSISISISISLDLYLSLSLSLWLLLLLWWMNEQEHQHYYYEQWMNNSISPTTMNNEWTMND